MAPSALACPGPDPVFVKTYPLVSSEPTSPVTAPAAVFNETSRPLATAPVICAATRTSGLSASKIAPTQLQPALETCSFLVPASEGSDPITHLVKITGTAISSASNIDTFIKGCQFQTITVPPSLPHHPAKSLLEYLATSRFTAAVGKPWSLDAIRAAIKRGPHTSIRNSGSTIFCREDLADRVSQGFSLLLTAERVIFLFGWCFRISQLASVPQDNQQDRLIYDSTAPPPGGDSFLPPSSEDTPDVNVSTDRAMAP